MYGTQEKRLVRKPLRTEETVVEYGDQDPLFDNRGEVSVTRTTKKPGMGAWGWVLIVAAIIVVIVTIILLIYFLTRPKTVTKSTEQNLTIQDIQGVTIKAVGATSIVATWTAIPNESDVVTLYAVPSGQTLAFNGKTPIGNPPSSGPVVAPQRTATITGLVPGASYDTTLVLTNPNVPGILAQVQNNGISLSAGMALAPKFSISSAGQCGSVTYGSTGTNTNLINQVFYQLGVTNPNSSLFHLDPQGFLCVTSQASILTSTTVCPTTSTVLFDDSTAGTGPLGIKLMSDLTADQISRAHWIYSDSTNQWCTANNRCIQYNVNSATTSILDAGGLVTAVTQPLFVNSTGSTKWLNNNFTTTT